MLKKIIGHGLAAASLACLIGATQVKAVEVNQEYQMKYPYKVIEGKNMNGVVERFYIDPKTFQVMQTIEKAPYDPHLRDRGPIPNWYKKYGFDVTAVYTNKEREDVMYLNHEGEIIHTRP